MCNTNKNNFLSVEENDEVINMFQVERIIEGNKPIMIKVFIERKEVEMEVDSGAGVSILPKEIYETVLPNIKLESRY